jgi:hypothetical protein
MNTSNYWDQENVTTVSKDEDGAGLGLKEINGGVLKIDEIGHLGHIGTVAIDSPEALDALIETLEAHRDQNDE